MTHHEKVPALTIVALVACAVPTKLTAFNQVLPALSQTPTVLTTTQVTSFSFPTSVSVLEAIANAGSINVSEDGSPNADVQTAVSEEVDTEATTLDADGQLVDAEGNLINSAGFLINAEGELIDANGNLLSEGSEGVLGAEIDLDGTGSDIAIPTIDSDVELSNANDQLVERSRWWWLLVPLAGLALLIWAATKRTDEEKVSYTTGTDSERTDLDTDQNDRISSGFDSDIVIGPDLIPDPGPTHSEMSDAGIFITDAPEQGMADTKPVEEKPVEEKWPTDPAVVNSEPDKAATAGTTDAKPLHPIPPGSASMQDASTSIKSLDPTDSSVDSINTNTLSASDVSQSRAYNAEAENINFSKDTAGEDLGRLCPDIRESTRPVDSSDNWLQRAKKRINEATDQMKQTATEIQDDVTKEG